jgi:putative endonuclease
MASEQLTTKGKGDAAEELALRHMQQASLTLLVRNYRTPGRGGGEIDLILRDRDGTLVFAEVRKRASTSHGGAAASVGATKQRRIIFVARQLPHGHQPFAAMPLRCGECARRWQGSPYRMVTCCI